MSDPKVIDPPAEIWLCYGDLDGEDAVHSEWSKNAEVLWCEEQIDNADVRYVLASMHDARVTDYEDVLADTRRLTRELDVAMHGDEGAAKQAALCDLIGPARKLRARVAELEAALREQFLDDHAPDCLREEDPFRNPCTCAYEQRSEARYKVLKGEKP